MNDDELRREYQRSATTTPLGPHPEPDELAELLGGAMAEPDRVAMLEHVLRCPTCGPELDLLRAAGAGARAAERRMPLSRWMAFAAAALILVGIGALTLRGHRVAVPVDVMRGNHAAVSVIEPAVGTTVAYPARFAWHAVDGAQSYHVELLTPRGDVIAAWSTLDTALVISDSLRLRTSESYDMWVRAMLADRTEVSSPLVRFNVRYP
jgi:hypothetical protein